jgi:hypothetical protein
MSMTAHPEPSGRPYDLVDAAADVAGIRSASYAGRDPDHLVTAEVDGDGVVIRIRLAATARTREPRVVERAVLAAVAAAQREIEQAWRAAASGWRTEGHVDGS